LADPISREARQGGPVHAIPLEPIAKLKLKLGPVDTFPESKLTATGEKG
jgi:hypothetical protein